MSAEFATTDRIAPLSGSVPVAAGGTVTYATGRPINIKRVTLVMTAAQTSAGAVATYGVRNVDDSSSTTIGTFTIPVSAINTVLKAEVAGVKAGVTGSDASQPATVTTGRVLGIQTNQPGDVELNPGQEFFLTVAAGGAGGTAAGYIEYQDQGSNPTRFNATDMAVTFS